MHCAILDAIRKGHSYLSAGPELLFTAESESGQTAMVGDCLPVEAPTLFVKWNNVQEGDVLRLIVDGQIREQMLVGVSVEQSWSLAADEIQWANVEMRDTKNDI